MNTNEFEKKLRQLSPLDDRTVEEIAEIAPVLDDAAKDRIEALCERKMRLEDMNTTNQVYAEGVKPITRTQRFRPVMTVAACLVLVAGIGGAVMLGRSHNVTPPVATDVPTEASDTTENASSEPLTNGLSLEDLHSMMEQNVKCMDYFLTLNGVTYNSEDLGDDTHEVETDKFASYAEMEEYVYSIFCDDFAGKLLNGNGCVRYLEYNGKFCVQPRTALDGVSFYEDWSSYEITNPANVDENTVTFDVTVNRIYDDGENTPATYVCKAIHESDGWRLEELYGYSEPQINGLYLEDLRNLMYRNADCLEHFITDPLSNKGDYLGVGIYEVDSEQFVSYEALESYVYSTYCDGFADELLTSYPCGNALYFEYDGKFCIEPAAALDGVSFPQDWSSFEITNPAAVDENTIVFYVVCGSVNDSDEEYGYLCKAIRESDGWRLEEMYGYEKPQGSTSSDPDASVPKDLLSVLVRRSMMLTSDYPTKGKALPNTSLYEVDFDNMSEFATYFHDYPSFEEYVSQTFTPDVADWILHDSIYKEVNGKLYMDLEKAAYTQETPVDWTYFTIEVDSYEDNKSGTFCTFRVIATDDPDFQFPDTTLEDRTEYYSVEKTNKYSGWKINTKPLYLVK